MRQIKIQQNWIDKAFSYVAPVRGARRMQARFAMSAANAYIGASKSRRQTSEWVTTSGDADSDQLSDLPTLRERSRDLARNVPIATGIINTKVTNIIGSGLEPKPRIDGAFLGMSDEQTTELESAIMREYRLATETQEIDIERTLVFKPMQSLVLRSMLESGDVFALLPMVKRAGSPYKTKVQIIEADRVTNQDNQIDSERMSGGIERDENGAPSKYHILDGHPGDLLSTKNMEWTSVKAFGEKTGRRNVLHIHKKLRPGQTRGMPDLAPAIELIKQLGTYSDEEARSAVVASLFTVFVETEDGVGLGQMDPVAETGAKSSDKAMRMAGGAIVDLRPGESIKTANPGRPNTAFDQFILAISRQIGAAVELPFEILVKHFTASYSAARAAMLEAWRYYIICRNAMDTDFCQPVYEAIFTEAVAIGRISAPGFFSGDPLIRKAYLRTEWVGPPRGQIDPVKENKADEIAEDRGWKTGSTNAAERGTDWEANNKQLAKEKEARKANGLEQEAPEPGANPNETPDDEDSPDKKDNEENKT